jgi:hypothetical protein
MMIRFIWNPVAAAAGHRICRVELGKQSVSITQRGLICDSADCTTKAGGSGIGKLKLIAACERCWVNHLLCAKAPRVLIAGEFAGSSTAAYVITGDVRAKAAFKLEKFGWKYFAYDQSKSKNLVLYN